MQTVVNAGSQPEVLFPPLPEALHESQLPHLCNMYLATDLPFQSPWWDKGAPDNVASPTAFLPAPTKTALVELVFLQQELSQKGGSFQIKRGGGGGGK